MNQNGYSQYITFKMESTNLDFDNFKNDLYVMPQVY